MTQQISDIELLKAIQMSTSLRGAAALLGLPFPTVYKRARQLVESGLLKATKPKGKKYQVYKLTPTAKRLLRGEPPAETEGEVKKIEGIDQSTPKPKPASDHEPPVPLTGLLADLAALSPSYLHESLIRIVLAGVVGRKAMIERGTISTGFPSLILIGPPGTGKTSLARLVFRLFGLDEATGIKYLPLSSPGEIGVRRIGSEREPRESWLWQLPLACFDEVSIAEKPLRDASFTYLLGERALAVEGEPITLRPFVIATFNPRQDVVVLPEGVERRAVICDLGGLYAQRYEIVDGMRAVLNGPLPRLDLDELAAKVEVDYREEDGAFLASLYRPLLVNRVDRMATDELPLWHLWQGYRALGLDPKEAAALVVYDVAVCLETRGLVKRDWRARLEAAYRGVEYQPPPPVPIDEERLREIERRAEQRRREAEEARLRELEARLERREQVAALKALINELEREVRRLPQLGCELLKRALKRRRVVLTGWQPQAQNLVKEDIIRFGWEGRIEAIKGELKRKLSSVEIEALAAKLKEIHGEVKEYEAKLASVAERKAEAAAELARRRRETGAPPALQPHFRAGTPRRLQLPQPALTREDVEEIERRWQEMTDPGLDLADYGYQGPPLPEPVRWPPKIKG